MPFEHADGSLCTQKQPGADAFYAAHYAVQEQLRVPGSTTLTLAYGRGMW